jgi:dienelactone hydrolase
MKTQTVEYHDGDVTLLGYLAYNDDVSGKRPGVLVMPRVCGPGVHSRSKAEKLAALGYVAFAGDYYGNGREVDNLNDAIKLAHSRFDDTTALRRRGMAALNKLASFPQVDSSRLASIGFCIGGNFSLELARDGVPLRGVVSFHGGLHTERPAQRGQVKAKILVCTGGDDRLVPLEQVNAFQAEMAAAGVDWQVITYGGVKHNFTDADAARLEHPALEYHKGADDRSWNAMTAFFKEIFA